MSKTKWNDDDDENDENKQQLLSVYLCVCVFECNEGAIIIIAGNW